MSQPSENAIFLQRDFPSANSVLLTGPRPVLVDTGFGSDVTALLDRLRAADVEPGDLQMIVNTHYHCDHAGGNAALQRDFSLTIAAYDLDARLINRRDRDAGSVEWLNQIIEPYTVDKALHDGDIIDTGAVQWQVIHAPGHTLGHICLFGDGVLIAGDTVHVDDVAWLNVFREGVGAIDRIRDTLSKLVALKPARIYSGHGGPTLDPQSRFDAARRRYDRWAQNPHRIGWHACKRIFTYALMLFDGLEGEYITPYLLGCPWFLDYSRYVFDTEPADFVQPLLAELDRAGATVWRDGKLYPTAPYNPPGPSHRPRRPG